MILSDLRADLGEYGARRARLVYWGFLVGQVALHRVCWLQIEDFTNMAQDLGGLCGGVCNWLVPWPTGIDLRRLTEEADREAAGRGLAQS